MHETKQRNMAIHLPLILTAKQAKLVIPNHVVRAILSQSLAALKPNATKGMKESMEYLANLNLLLISIELYAPIPKGY